jgi:hypothetical protein
MKGELFVVVSGLIVLVAFNLPFALVSKPEQYHLIGLSGRKVKHRDAREAFGPKADWFRRSSCRTAARSGYRSRCPASREAGCRGPGGWKST